MFFEIPLRKAGGHERDHLARAANDQAIAQCETAIGKYLNYAAAAAATSKARESELAFRLENTRQALHSNEQEFSDNSGAIVQLKRTLRLV